MEPIEGQIIEEKDINNININEQPQQAPEKECKSCKQKGIKLGQLSMIITSFYILFAAIYGTIKLIHEVIHLFK